MSPRSNAAKALRTISTSPATSPTPKARRLRGPQHDPRSPLAAEPGLSKRQQLEYRLADRNAATGPVPCLLSRDQDLVPKVQDFFGVPADVLERIPPITPQFAHPIVAVEGRIQVGGHQVSAWPILARGIPAREDRLVISAVGGSVDVLDAAGEDQSPEPRAWRRVHEAAGKKTGNRGKAHCKSLLGRPALACVYARGRQRDSDSAQALDLLLRHRPPSIAICHRGSTPGRRRRDRRVAG